MSDLIKFQLISSDKEEKESKNPLQKDSFVFHKIKHITHKNTEPRSKSAPLEENENEDDPDFLGSYNYYIYYNSIVPRDPHLPKPTYIPNQDLCDIKETKAKDEEDQPELNDTNNKHLETIANMMNNLNIEGNSNMNDINKLINEIPNTNIEFQNQLGNSSNTNNALMQGDSHNLFADFFNNSNIENNNNENNSNENNNKNKNDMNEVDNINLHNFQNNNINMNNNNNQKNMDNDFNSFGNNNFLHKNNNSNININNINSLPKKNEFDMNNNSLNNNKFNNINYKRSNNEPMYINNNINTKDQLLNMMLLQNLQNMNTAQE